METRTRAHVDDTTETKLAHVRLIYRRPPLAGKGNNGGCWVLEAVLCLAGHKSAPENVACSSSLPPSPLLASRAFALTVGVRIVACAMEFNISAGASFSAPDKCPVLHATRSLSMALKFSDIFCTPRHVRLPDYCMTSPMPPARKTRRP